ncbi:glycoside hydrolase family 3 C-terminal domain-containing protein [Georgenia sp. TF02-10]|uniref:glycoside hydrolase family 3 protein n=1 Tax=Georgenia sp. TF02-10 TaxID=2917725 RepID=UPI001FA80547|nr:glycoside hydrolase family 3 N-terminal domain-containing protein [Georgenia sp. TF02-10]UNX54914.1 glycoside hydrolase family 3 C-terminal domain-containing protein [Georgenia sp. TF02-10]
MSRLPAGSTDEASPEQTSGQDREARVQAVLDGLDLRQRVGQLNQRLLGWRAVERRGGRWVLTDEALAEIERWSGLGAIYGLMRADAWSGRSWENGVTPDDRLEVVDLVQQAVRGANPQGLAAFVVEEAPHGHQALGGTILPQNLALAATWDPDLLEEASAAVATELAASGVDLALVSGLDVLRDGRWGRSEECFGEDPFLAATLVGAVVRGMQGADRRRLGRDGVGVVLKHLAAQGEAVGGRNGQSAIVGPRDLHEIHLAPAAAGVRAGAVGMMAAYNDIDGVPCCANPWLLQTWLRQEQGFDGIVMADGLAVDQLLPLTGSIPDAGRLALRSGVDVSLWDEGFTTLVRSAEQDEQTFRAVTEACRRVLRLKDRLGLLPARSSARAGRERIELRGRLPQALAESADLSRRLAASALVLLDGHIPTEQLLAPEATVLVVGPNADDVTPFLGDYVPPLRDGEYPTVLEQLTARLPGRVLTVAPTDPGLAQAVRAATVVVAVLGGTSHRSYADQFDPNGAAAATRASAGEGVDLADLRLPGQQDELLSVVRAAATGPVVSVVVAGRPHVLTGVLAASDATLWAGYAGPHGPRAVADALLGDVVPAGRLPVTLLRASGAGPVRHNDRWSPDGVYRDVPSPVLLPFAHAAAGSARVASATLTRRDGRVTVEVLVQATGDVDGELVLPVLARRRGGPVLPRQQELLGLRRVRVPAGQPVVVTVDLAEAEVFAPVGLGSRYTDIYVADLHAGRLEAPAGAGEPAARPS